MDQRAMDQQIAAFVKWIEHELRSAMAARSGAEMKFAAQLTDGGIRDEWMETKIRKRKPSK